MDSQKSDNTLNLSQDATALEREKSMELLTGFNPVERTWDLIVKYYGDISSLEEYGAEIVYLSQQYAVITIKEQFIDVLENMQQIIYIEKPKRLFFSVANARRASCISGVQVEGAVAGGPGLFGTGVICACIDSGIDYMHPVFRNEDGSTRILKIWDQSISGNPPEGYRIGSVYDEEEINRAINASDSRERYSIVPSRDFSGHGTHVAGIMAGNFASNKNNNLGVATKSRLLVVKLGRAQEGGYPLTSELMQAVDFVIKQSRQYGMPVAINLSFGNTYGSHDGTSLVETFIDAVIQQWQSVICIGTGNEGNAAGHTSGYIVSDINADVQLAVGGYQQSFSIQIWKQYQDIFDIFFRGPSGRDYVLINSSSGTSRYNVDNNMLLVYYGEPSPYSPFQEIYIDIIPDGDYVTEGIWQIELRPVRIVNGRYDMWLPSNQVLSSSTGFTRPGPDTTLTIPSTALNAISVGGYDSRNMSFADFSGRGYTRLIDIVKPDLVAPAVDINSAEPGGTTGVRSGTSMATPFVTGSAALLMEWGIVRGNDRYLYGEKVKAYLIRGARGLPGEPVPSVRQGWGALCLADSIPM